MLAQKISQLRRWVGVDQRRAEARGTNSGEPDCFGQLRLSMKTWDALGTTNVDQAKGTEWPCHQAYIIGANDQLLTSIDYSKVIVVYPMDRRCGCRT